jgi:hypothetical protein
LLLKGASPQQLRYDSLKSSICGYSYNIPSKAVPLDTLGNLPNADAPLTELVEESIVVKKFIYDNDVEPVQEVIVMKNTRLRSKKGKA